MTHEKRDCLPLSISSETTAAPLASWSKKVPVGIYDELHRLTATTTWGPVGAEAVLAQLYPERTSLFYDVMDVPTARKEALRFSTFLQLEGVDVRHVRDHLTQALSIGDVEPQKVKDAIVAKARRIRSEQNHTPSENIYTHQSLEDVAMELVDQDIQRYGEGPALALNQALILTPELPMGNMIYARDQMNVLLDARVVSRMAKAIRRPEVALYERVHDGLLGEHQKIEIPEGETFEGGDAYIFNKTIYVGVGSRTTFGAAIAIFEKLQQKLEERDMRFAVVEDIVYQTLPPETQQESMHLDTFSGPIGDHQIAVCLEEAEKRKVSFVGIDADGKVRIAPTELNFVEHLKAEGNTIYVIPKEEQDEFGCNFLMLDDTNVILPLQTNETTNKRLQEAGKTIHNIDLYQTTRGYGAAHCITGQQQRLEVIPNVRKRR